MVWSCLIFRGLHIGVPTAINRSCWSTVRGEEMLQAVALAAELLRGVCV